MKITSFRRLRFVGGLAIVVSTVVTCDLLVGRGWQRGRAGILRGDSSHEAASSYVYAHCVHGICMHFYTGRVTSLTQPALFPWHYGHRRHRSYVHACCGGCYPPSDARPGRSSEDESLAAGNPQMEVTLLPCYLPLTEVAYFSSPLATGS